MDKSVTKERLEEALRKGLHDKELTILGCELNAATQPGDNYLSYMTRASCRIQAHDREYTQNFVIKTLPSNSPMMLKMIDELKCNQVEAHLLGDVLPEIHNILDLTGSKIKLSAQLYFSEVDTSENTILIMEDLCESGFQVANRCEGLNEAQCHKVVEALASFHVASKVAIRRNPELKKNLSVGAWSKGGSETIDISYRKSYHSLCEMIDGKQDPELKHQLESFKNKIPSIFYEEFDCNEQKIPHVLTHGDVWTNNIMFKCTGDNEYEVRFVDFQLSSIRSPMTDIIYFIFTSPSNDIRFRILDDLLGTYHKQWCHISALIGEYTDITVNDIREEFRRVHSFGLAVMCSIYPVISLPKEEAIDTTKEKKDTHDRRFKSESTQRALLAGLEYFKKQGLFS